MRHIISQIYATFLLILTPFLKTKTGSTRRKQRLEVRWRWRKTVHIIGIQPVQNGSVLFRHVKLPRSATATERTWDVTETFLSERTFGFNYTWESVLNGDFTPRNGKVMYSVNQHLGDLHVHGTIILKTNLRTFDVITSIVLFLWARNTAARDVTSAPHRTSYDVTRFSNLHSETVDSNMAAKQETCTRRYEKTDLFHFTFNATLQDTRYHVSSTL
jgi:hypothetical protein